MTNPSRISGGGPLLGGAQPLSVRRTYVRCLKMRILRILRGEFCDENVKFMAAMGRPHIRHPFGCNSVALHADMMVLSIFLFFWVQNNTGNLGAILPVPPTCTYAYLERNEYKSLLPGQPDAG